MRTIACVMAAAAMVAAYPQTAPIRTDDGCKWGWKDRNLFGSKVGATFDVSKLTLPITAPYAYYARASYNEQMDTDLYEYHYNVCGPTPTRQVPSQCKSQAHSASAYRTKNVGPALSTETADAGAVPADYCKAMTTSYPKVGGETVTAGLHDPDRPAHGWSIAYPPFAGAQGPEFQCAPPPSAANRTVNQIQFRHIFICEDFENPSAEKTNTIYNQSLVLDENGELGCFIDVYMFGHAGCPTECPVVGGKLCGGNGICDYDRGIKKARCFCNDNYIESDCTVHTAPAPVAGFVLLSLFGILVGAGSIFAYWYFRVRGTTPGASGGAAGGDMEGYYEAEG